MTRQSIATILVLAVTGNSLPAQTPVPPGESLVTGDTLAAFHLQTAPEHADAVDFGIVESSGPGFARAWRVETKRETIPMASIEVRAVNHRAVALDDVALVRFFARMLSTADETGRGRVQLVVRRNGVDFNSSFELGLTFGREWQEFLLPFKFHKDFPREDVAFMFRFGRTVQVVELGGLDVLYYGRTLTRDSLPQTRFTYKGREPDAAWRGEAHARIERIRKSDFEVRVVNAAGQPVAGAKVTVAQKRSAFQWSSALQFARLVHDSPDNLIYRRKVLELFNAASPENDLKWVTWVGDWGADFSPEQSLAGLRWLREHGFHSRGHVLVWPGWKNLPQSVQELRGTGRQGEIPGIVLTHIREMARATRGLLDEWDVLNEPFTNHDLMDIFGREIMTEWFKVAHGELPGVELYLNDFSNHDVTTDPDHVAHFEDTARFLLAAGAPLHGLGLQAHISSEPNAPVEVLKVLDRYAAFNLPIRITEFDVWTEDAQLQADYTRDFLTLCFSHPSVVGVQLWGFWESAHWRPNAAMFRADWSEKPNAQAYRDLVLRQWRTDLALVTDDRGRAGARGFHGDLVAIVEHNGRRIEQAFTLPTGAPPVGVTVKLP